MHYTCVYYVVCPPSMRDGDAGVWLPRAVVIGGNRGPRTCNLGAEVTFRGSRLVHRKRTVPSCLGRRPIQDCMLRFLWTSSHAGKLASEPLSIDPWAPHLRCLRHLPPRACVGGGCCCCNAAAGAAATLQFNCAPMAPHHTALATRRAARCCSASVGELASRLATHVSS